MKRILLSLAALAAAAGAVFTYVGARGGAAASPARTVPLAMREYSFNGSNPTLTVRPGERVHFVVTNDEQANILHNFRIVGLDVPCGPPMNPGERREVTVTMPRSGEFAYTCCTHPGMGGRIVVAPR